MGCILSCFKKIEAEESDIVSIRQNSILSVKNNHSSFTPAQDGQEYFEVDYRNDINFYAMHHYRQLRKQLNEIINQNVNNKLTKDIAEPILDQLRAKFLQYKNQVLDENRKYRKYLKTNTLQSRISELNNEAENDNSEIIFVNTSERVNTSSPLKQGIQENQSKINNSENIDINQSHEQGISSQKIDDNEQHSSPFKFIKPPSNLNMTQDNYSPHNISMNKKNNFDEKFQIKYNFKKDKKEVDVSIDDIQLNEIIRRSLPMNQVTQNPLSRSRRLTDKTGEKQIEQINDGGDRNSKEGEFDNKQLRKQNTDQPSQKLTQVFSQSTPEPLVQNNNNTNILKNFEKLNLMKPKQIIVDIQQGKLIVAPKEENVYLKISTKSKTFETNSHPEGDLKIFQAFQINLENDENQFQITFMQNNEEITKPQTFQIDELLDQKVYVKNMQFNQSKINQVAALLLIKVQYIHDILAIQKYWIEETDARIKQIDQIKNYISTRRGRLASGNTGQRYDSSNQHTFNNMFTMSQEINSMSDDGSSYFDNQFYAR